MALCPSGVNKELRERRRALKAAMEEERNKEKAARDEEKQEEKIKAVLEKNRHHQYLRDAALKALQVKTISTPSNPHIDGQLGRSIENGKGNIIECFYSTTTLTRLSRAF
jgi:hypothetical protein